MTGSRTFQGIRPDNTWPVSIQATVPERATFDRSVVLEIVQPSYGGPYHALSLGRVEMTRLRDFLNERIGATPDERPIHPKLVQYMNGNPATWTQINRQSDISDSLYELDERRAAEKEGTS